MSLKIFLLILLAEALGAAMHLFFKKGINTISYRGSNKFAYDTRYFKNLFKIPWIWYGVIAVLCGLFIWLTVLAQVNLSVAYPFDSLQYILVLPVSFFIFREYVDRQKILGSILILAGIWLVTLNS